MEIITSLYLGFLRRWGFVILTFDIRKEG